MYTTLLQAIRDCISTDARTPQNINQIQTPQDALRWIRALETRSTDDLVARAKAAVAADAVTENTVLRIQCLLKSLHDPHGPEAFALTLIHSVIIDHAADQFIIL